MKSSYLKGNMCWLYCLKTEKLGAKPCSSPMTQNLHLTREYELFGDLERYRKLVGKLNYLIVTCPNIAHSISVVS